MSTESSARHCVPGASFAANFMIESLEPRRLLSGGQFDPTFGAGGAAWGALFHDGQANAVALQADGKIVAGGAQSPSFNGGTFALARFQANGALDRGFGSGAKVTTSFGDVDAAITAVAVQRDGKIVAAGYSDNGINASPQVSRFAVARYLPNGMPDPSFGSGGKVTVSFFGNDRAGAVAIEPDGTILVAGTATRADNTSAFALAHFSSRGRLDDSFGFHGKATAGFPGYITDAHMLVQQDGRIVVGGTNVLSGAVGVALARYRPNGSLDPTFGDRGRTFVGRTEPGVQLDFTLSTGAALAMQPDGKILAVIQGLATNFGAFDLGGGLQVFRVTTSGALDTHFGNHGSVLTPTPQSDAYVPSQLLVQRDGKLVIAGTDIVNDELGGFTKTLLLRLTAGGAIDPSFGSGGQVTAPLANTGTVDGLASGWNAAVLRPDGRIVTVGTSSPSTQLDFALAQYTTGGILDDSFGYHGAVQQPNGITGLVGGIGVQPGGKIVVAGSELSPNPGDPFSDGAGAKPTDAVLARYNANGTLDTGFGVDGRVLLQIGDDAEFKAMAVEPDGSIIAAGLGTSGGTTMGAVVRFHSDGTLDRSFGTGGIALAPFGDSQDPHFNALAVQPNGDIVVAGTATTASGLPTEMIVARYLPTGTLDPHFGNNGQVILQPGEADNVAGAVALQRDGKIVVAGLIDTDQAVVRLRTDGSLDRTFGTAGIVRTTVGGFYTDYSERSGLVIMPSGAIVAGTSSLLARYLPTGRLDPSFGGHGEVLAESGPGLSSLQIQSLALDRRGGIIAGGVVIGDLFVAPDLARPFLTGPPLQTAAVARFTDAGFDTSFGEQGGRMLDDGVVSNQTSAVIALQPDGKILAADTDLFRLTAS